MVMALGSYRPGAPFGHPPRRYCTDTTSRPPRSACQERLWTSFARVWQALQNGSRIQVASPSLSRRAGRRPSTGAVVDPGQPRPLRPSYGRPVVLPMTEASTQPSSSLQTVLGGPEPARQPRSWGATFGSSGRRRAAGRERRMRRLRNSNPHMTMSMLSVGRRRRRP